MLSIWFILSILFTANKTGLFVFLSICATSLSAAVRPAFPSTTNIIIWAMSTANIAWFLIWDNITSPLSFSIPPVSIKVKYLFNHSTSANILSLVTPGVSSTIDILFPANLLNSVDFPTFGLPTTATIGLLSLILISLLVYNFFYKIFSFVLTSYHLNI